jgi:hypothetical protein
VAELSFDSVYSLSYAAYLQCASCLTTSADADRVKASGRLMVKGVIAKIRVNTDKCCLTFKATAHVHMLLPFMAGKPNLLMVV